MGLDDTAFCAERFVKRVIKNMSHIFFIETEVVYKDKASKTEKSDSLLSGRLFLINGCVFQLYGCFISEQVLNRRLLLFPA